MDNRDAIQLLVEIRDVQKEHLLEYRRVTQESLELARKSVGKQMQISKLYQWTIAIGGMLLVCFVVWLFSAIISVINK